MVIVIMIMVIIINSTLLLSVILNVRNIKSYKGILEQIEGMNSEEIKEIAISMMLKE